MKKESDILRALRTVQYGVPDREFLWIQPGLQQNSKKRNQKNQKQLDKINIVGLREQVKTFYESFKGGDRKAGDEKKVRKDLMSITEMNEFRARIAGYAGKNNADPNVLALDGIIKYIDLKNSGLSQGKQKALQNSLYKIGHALSIDGGLSIFHITWFLSVYDDYLSHYTMFPDREYKDAMAFGSAEARKIAKDLFNKQHEIVQYSKLIASDKTEVKQINKISLDNQLKLSTHYHHGCDYGNVKNIFIKCFRSKQGESHNRKTMSEVTLIMVYALLFARIPMLYKLVDNIVKAIPNIGIDTDLCKQKIRIACQFNNFTLVRAVNIHSKSKSVLERLFSKGESLFDFCFDVIRENNLERTQLMNEYYYHPFLKQAVILITFKDVFMLNKEKYRKMIAKSIELLKPVKEGKNSLVPGLTKLAGFALYYERHLESIQAQTFVES